MTRSNGAGREPDVEAIIIGAGFAGLRMLHELRRNGVSARVFEAAPDIGGTWYWNRYPGARTDTESWAYCFRFDQEMLDGWDWQERYASREQIHRYLCAVADRLDLRSDITCSTRVTAGTWDEDASQWVVETDTGETLRCRFLVSSTGLISHPLQNPYPGLDDFTGDVYSTSRWPEDDVNLAGEKVAVIGTGASGVQIITEVAHVADQLTVFQRTPNYVMPGRNHALSPRQKEWIRNNHGTFWEYVDQHIFAYPWPMKNRMYGEMTAEQRSRALDEAWEAGGFHFAFDTFSDLLFNPEANQVASDFVRDKIRAIVQDPQTAEALCPSDHPLFGKRPPVGNFYYETYNMPHVSLVDIKRNPIESFTPGGVRTADGVEHAADVIIFALGFDAFTGAILDLDLKGRGGVSIQERWKDGGATYLGMFVDGFPNFAAIYGPQTAFTNIIATIERQAIFIADTIAEARRRDADAFEAQADAVMTWVAGCQQQLDFTLLATGEAKSWFLGTNVEGKPNAPLVYLGGAPAYYAELDRVQAADFRGLVIERAAPGAVVS